MNVVFVPSVNHLSLPVCTSVLAPSLSSKTEVISNTKRSYIYYKKKYVCVNVVEVNKTYLKHGIICVN